MAGAPGRGTEGERSWITEAKHLRHSLLTGCGPEERRVSLGGKPVAPAEDGVATCSRFGPALAG